jgi:hypothetical protein
LGPPFADRAAPLPKISRALPWADRTRPLWDGRFCAQRLAPQSLGAARKYGRTRGWLRECSVEHVSGTAAFRFRVTQAAPSSPAKGRRRTALADAPFSRERGPGAASSARALRLKLAVFEGSSMDARASFSCHLAAGRPRHGFGPRGKTNC